MGLEDFTRYTKEESLHGLKNGRIIFSYKIIEHDAEGNVLSVKEEDTSSWGYDNGFPITEQEMHKLINCLMEMWLSWKNKKIT